MTTMGRDPQAVRPQPTEETEAQRILAKRPYSSPKLTDHGSLVRLTQQVREDFDPLGS